MVQTNFQDVSALDNHQKFACSQQKCMGQTKF